MVGGRFAAATTAVGTLAALAVTGAPNGWSAGYPQPGSPCAARPGSAWCDVSLSDDQRAHLLLAQMSENEKFAMMAGDADNGAHTGINDGVARLSIPPLTMTDAGLGVRQGSSTALPSGTALGATWDPNAASAYASVVGNEAWNKGNDVLLGPNVNFLRDPRGGRAFEQAGEDPELTSRTAVAYVRALQDTGVMADVKHFVGNEQETNRNGENSVIDQRTLREIYLAPFEAAIRQGQAASFMPAYNATNGPHMTENCPLVRGVAERDWQFPGFTISDWGATYLGGTQNTVTEANCGTTLEMPTAAMFTPPLLQAAVSSGRVSQAAIDDAVLRQLRMMFHFGLFDKPPAPSDGPIDYVAHFAAAQSIEQQAITLLKNDNNALPLHGPTVHRIAVIGPSATRNVTGGGSASVTAQRSVDALTAIKNRAGSDTVVTYDDGRDQAKAAADARAADVAVVFGNDFETEGADRACLALNCSAAGPQITSPTTDPGVTLNQDGLISQVAAAQPNTTVVLQAGAPVLMPWLSRVRAVVDAYYPGEAGGPAIAATLFGDVNPSGRLPFTIPAREDDTPTANNSARYPGAVYSEGVFTGYRWYDQQHRTPLFPFGFGLSYTTFDYHDLKVTDVGQGKATVSVRITNTGQRPGAEVPQLYLGLPDAANAPEPPSWLRDFTKVRLEPGQSATVTFPLTARAFSHWDTITHSWRIQPGCYTAKVGSSDRDIHASALIPQGGASCG